jgi:hypothetical protein
MDKELPFDFSFCTECGRDLRNFSLDKMIFDIEYVRENFTRCRQNGKFKGEYCSKLFIALDFDPDEVFLPDDSE